MATTKEKLPVLGIRASGYYLRQVAFIIRQVAITIRQVAITIRQVAITIRQVAVTCCRSTSIVRNLKFLTPFFIFLTIKQYHTIYKP